MEDRSNTTAERRHVSPLWGLHLLRVCHFTLGLSYAGRYSHGCSNNNNYYICVSKDESSYFVFVVVCLPIVTDTQMVNNKFYKVHTQSPIFCSWSQKCDEERFRIYMSQEDTTTLRLQ